MQSDGLHYVSFIDLILNSFYVPVNGVVEVILIISVHCGEVLYQWLLGWIHVAQFISIANQHSVAILIIIVLARVFNFIMLLPFLKNNQV